MSIKTLSIALGLFLAVGSGSACSDAAMGSPIVASPVRSGLRVTLRGRLDQLDRLRISASIMTKDGRNQQAFPIPDHDVKSTLGLDLPSDLSGLLTVSVEGIAATRRVLASGSGRINVTPEFAGELLIHLAQTPFDCFPNWTCASPFPGPDTIHAVWAFHENPGWGNQVGVQGPVWAMGDRNRFEQFDGDLWRPLPQLPNILNDLGNGFQINSISQSSASPASDMWIAVSHRPSGRIFQLPAGSPDSETSWREHSVPAQKVWAADANTAWAIARGYLAYWDGTKWNEKTPSGPEFYGIGGTGPSDVWVVGNVVLHGDASALARKADPINSNLGGGPTNMHAVWVDKQTKTVWMVGRLGAILRGEYPYSAPWETIPNPVQIDGDMSYLHDIAGSAADDIWAVGDNGTLLHWNGSQWLAVQSGSSASLRSVSVRARDDVWIGGEGGTVLHWNGRTLENKGGGMPNFTAIWGSSANDIWAVGKRGAIYHFDGTSWQNRSVDTRTNYSGIWGRSASDVWLVGMEIAPPLFKPVVRHFDGKSWQTRSALPSLSGSIWGTKTGSMLIPTRGPGEYLRFDAAHTDSPVYETIQSLADAGETIDAMDGTDAGNIWALGSGLTLAQFTGQSWKKITKLGTFAGFDGLKSLRVLSGREAWIAATGTRSFVYRFKDGQTSTFDMANAKLGAIGGISADALFFGGFENSLAVFDETLSAPKVLYAGDNSVEFRESPQRGIRAMFTPDGRTLWAVGDNGLIMTRPLPEPAL